jgi:hypothetical protein
MVALDVDIKIDDIFNKSPVHFPYTGAYSKDA